MVTPTCMNDYGSLPALLCFPFVLCHIVLCFNCGVVHYIFANSICLCLLFFLVLYPRTISLNHRKYFFAS